MPDAFSGLDQGDEPTRFDLVLRRALNELSHPPRHKGPFRKKDFPVVNTGNFVVPSCFLNYLPEVSHCTREEMLRDPGGTESWTLSWKAPTCSLPPICSLL